MFSFLGLRKDSKKSPEKELDGGFVIIGEKYMISELLCWWFGAFKQLNRLTLHQIPASAL